MTTSQTTRSTLRTRAELVRKAARLEPKRAREFWDTTKWGIKDLEELVAKHEYSCVTCGNSFRKPAAAERGDLSWCFSCHQGAPEAEPPEDEKAVAPAKPKMTSDELESALGPLAGILAPLLQDLMDQGVDEDAVRAIAQDELAKTNKVVHEHVVTLNLNGKPPTVITGAHRQMDRLATLLALGKNVYLYGPAGAGKTTLAQQAAEAIGSPFYALSLSQQSPRADILGFIHANGELVRSQFRDAYEHGGIILLDELDNAADTLRACLNTALDNKMCGFPDKLVKMHPDFRCIAAGNTSGRGGTLMYSARTKMDAASPERYAYVKIDYDEDLELRLALARNPLATPWVEWVQGVRAYCQKTTIELVVSPRASMDGALLLAATDWPVDEIAEMSLWKGLDETTRTRILANHPLPSFGHGTRRKMRQAVEGEAEEADTEETPEPDPASEIIIPLEPGDETGAANETLAELAGAHA